MEFEIIEDGDEALFDASTNPSLHGENAFGWSAVDPADEAGQRALLIPEEEQLEG